MNQTLAVTKIEAVEEIGPGIFEVRVLLEDASIRCLAAPRPWLGTDSQSNPASLR